MRILVAGSYPPVPGAASAATLAAVRRALSGRNEVFVVSPRVSAAHFHGPMTGLGAPWTLRRRGKSVKADTLVLSIERGMPFAVGMGKAHAKLEAWLLGVALRRFEHLSLVVTGDLGVDPGFLRGLCSRAEEISVSSEEQREIVAASLAMAPEAFRVVPSYARSRQSANGASFLEGAEPEARVTVNGPTEWPRGTRVRHAAAFADRAATYLEARAAGAARAVLGEHAGKLGRPLRRFVGPLQERLVRRARAGRAVGTRRG